MDLANLNQRIKREAHPSVDFKIGKTEWFKGFLKDRCQQCVWQESYHLLTTFINPWGRFCFNPLPHGILKGTDQFQKCMSDIFEGIESVECQVDDIIVHGKDQVQHDACFHTVLKRLAEAHLTLTLAKCEFSVTKFTCCISSWFIC